MKICFVLEYYFPHIGGAETLFKNLAERLVKRGHQCFVITSRVPQTRRCEELNGVSVHRVDTPKFLQRYWFTILSIPTVYRMAKDCDILHTTTYNGAFPAFFVSKLVKKPAVITILEILLSHWRRLSGFNWFSAKWHELMEKVIVTLPFDRYVSISYYTRNYVRLLGVDDNRCEVVYPGVDYDLFANNGKQPSLIRERLGLKNSFVYLFYGRPGFFKGVEYLIRAVPLITEKIPESKLLIILSKEPVSKYKQVISLIKRLEIEDSLILLESTSREELVRYILSSDCVVSPSLTEGFGFTCIEACASDKPVVVTDVGAIPEIVFGKYIFIKPRSPQDICRGVQSVYNGVVSSKPKKDFTWEECAAKYEKVYKEIFA